MTELAQRIFVAALAIVLILASIRFIRTPDKMYNEVEGYRDRNPLARTINPLAQLNSPTFSRISSIAIGLGMLAAGVLLLVACFLGRAEQ